MPRPEQADPIHPVLIELLECDNLNAAGYMISRRRYREVMVGNGDLVDGPFHYSSGDRFDQFQARLAAAVGEQVDNHEAYMIRDPRDGSIVLCLSFTDWRLRVGSNCQPF